MITTMEEAKLYLRVDSSDEDDLVQSITASADALCADVARLSAEEYEAIAEHNGEGSGPLTIRGEEKSEKEVIRMQNLLRIAEQYALGYLFEHREEADHHDLVMTLRNLLSSIREGVV